MATQPAQPVPHLTTALVGPLHQVESVILERQAQIESWLRGQWRKTPEPFYASVDLRNSGYKVAPVDTNLFPAGFNNLNPSFEALCIQAIQLALERQGGASDRILLVPESHTRNRFYLSSLGVLKGLVEKAGFEVRIGSMLKDLDGPLNVELDNGDSLTLLPLERDGDRLRAGDFNPDLILLNNDLSSGTPEILEGIAQPILPPLSLGWGRRSKSVHFGYYREVAAEFARLLDLDPWLIDPLFRNCGEIDFMKREGSACLQSNVTDLLARIQEKYDEYGVDCKPYVMVKADSGTYGMGVMSAQSPEDVLELNRKQRTRMATTKEGKKVTKVIIQEGVYTHETWGVDNNVAEPVVYMIGHNVVGGFYRVHEKRSANESLNAPGMRFEPLAFDDCCISPDRQQSPDAHPNRFYTYGVIARLAMLAAAREKASL